MMRRVTALILLGALAFPASALAQLVHHCRMAGLVLVTCCCHGDPHDHGPRGATLESVDCCDPEARDAAPSPVPPAPLAALAPPPTAPVSSLGPPAASVLPASPRALVARGARAPPPLHGRGVYLETCTFLI